VLQEALAGKTVKAVPERAGLMAGLAALASAPGAEETQCASTASFLVGNSLNGCLSERFLSVLVSPSAQIQRRKVQSLENCNMTFLLQPICLRV
jgi:hypothetical protein